MNTIPDSGASSHYLRPDDAHCATKITRNTNGPTVTLPNNSTITADRLALLPLSSQLSPLAQQAHVLPQLKNTSLLSIGQLCDDNCAVVFRRDDVQVFKNKDAITSFLNQQQPILKGERNHTNKLWNITLMSNPNAPPNQVVLPQIHGALYPKQVTTDDKSILAYRKPVKSNPSYNNVFSALDDYIDIQECNMLVNQQLKLDRLQAIKKFNTIYATAREGRISKNCPCSISLRKHFLEPSPPHHAITDSPPPVALAPINHNLNVILCKDEHAKDLVNYLHGCCFWPVKSTFLRAIRNNHFVTWPGLEAHLVHKHLNKCVHTVKGHLKQERQGLQSTDSTHRLRQIQAKLTRLKATNPSASLKDLLEKDIHDDFFPPSDEPNEKTNAIMYSMIESSPTGLGYFDTTGRFPYKSA